MKRKRQLTLNDWSQIPTAPVKTTPGYDRDNNARIKREQREEQEESERSIRESRERLATTQRELQEEFRAENDEVRSYWSKPLDTIQPANVVVDLLGNFSLRTGRQLDDDEELSVYRSFMSDLANKQIRLQSDAKARLEMYFAVLARKRGVEITLANWLEALDRLVSLGILVEGRDVTGYQPWSKPRIERPTPPPVEQPNPGDDEILATLSTENREQSREIKRILGKHWSREFEIIFWKWVASLRDNFGYEFPVDELGVKAAEYIERWNLPFWRHDTWDKIRVSFVKRGYFPDSMLTPSERFESFVENSADLSNREVRQKINQWQQDINDGRA